MINTTDAFKIAIRASARRIKAKLILSDLTIEQVDLIELDSLLTDEDDFIIGTANMDVMKIEISDDPLAPLAYSFDGKEIEVQLGVVLADLTTEFYGIGKYTVEKSDRKDSKIYLDLVDRMYKADKQYISDLTYPATLKQILTSASTQAGLNLITTTFSNMDYIVNIEPVYEDISCRQVLAYVAELAGGYARINGSGSLIILNLGAVSVAGIIGDHYIDWKMSESAPGVIDKVIVKIGAEEASSGTGINIYTIVDNLFVQNPADVVGNIYTVLSAVNYKAGEMNWIGDYSLEMGDKVTIDGEDTYILNRKLKYAGGLRETLKMPGKSNIEKDSTGKSNTNLEIKKIKTRIKIISGEIQQTIEDTVSRTEFTQTVDGFVFKVGEVEKAIENIELTPGPPGADAINVDIFSTNGNIFKNDAINTTLIVRVYKGTEDITDTIDANRFKWTRVSSDAEGDILWNNANFGGTKEVNITSGDVNNRATFNVTII